MLRRIAFTFLAVLGIGIVAVCYEWLPFGSPVLGIDLGSTNARMGVYKNHRLHIVPDQQGNLVTPSYATWCEDQTCRPTPEVISAMLLTKMKESAEAFLNQTVKYAVMTVPVHFTDTQIQATRDAATIAGLTVERIIKEPVAAAIANGLDSKRDERNVLVYDLGGRTLQVALLYIDYGVFEVLAASNDAHLGGINFDENVMQHYIDKLKKRDNVDIQHDERALQKLRLEMKRVRHVLSTQPVAHVEIDDIAFGTSISDTLTRAKFEELNRDLVKKTLFSVDKVLDSANMSIADVDDIVLVGGSTRIPMVRALLKDHFDGLEPLAMVNPDQAVVEGATIQGGILAGRFSDGVPCYYFELAHLSLGIETVGGVMAKIVQRNTIIATTKSMNVSTYQDNQTSVLIRVFEGDRVLTKDNILLASLELIGIAPAPRGVPQIEVTIEIDDNRVVSVRAMDIASGKTGNITIPAYELCQSEEEIQTRVLHADEFAEHDQKSQAHIAMRNGLDSLLHLYALKSDGIQVLPAGGNEIFRVIDETDCVDAL